MAETFEQVLRAAQAAGSLTPAWKKFIKTKFFVAILRSPDDDPKNFLLSLTRNPSDGKPVVIVSEVRDRLDQHQGDGMAAVSGADIVRRLGNDGGILIELADSLFSISRKRVAWLRSGIEVTEARVATRKTLLAAAPAAPLPKLNVETDPPTVPANGGVFAALAQGSVLREAATPARREREPAPPRVERRTRERAKPRTGLEFFQPSEFQGATSPSLPEENFFPLTPGAERLARARMVAGSVPVMLSVIGIGIVAAIALVMGGMDPPAPPAASVQAPAAPRFASAPAAVPLAASAPSALAGMIRFTPSDNSFSVMVPGTPDELELTPEQVEQMGELRMHQYKLVTDERIYTMQATDYGERLPENIAAAMDGMQASIVGQDGTLIHAKTIGLQRAAGREVRVRLGNGAIRAARFTFIGSKFCMVAVVAADGDKGAAEIDAFLNSFELH